MFLFRLAENLHLVILSLVCSSSLDWLDAIKIEHRAILVQSIFSCP